MYRTTLLVLAVFAATLGSAVTQGTESSSSTKVPPTIAPTPASDTTTPANNATSPANNPTTPANNATTPDNTATIPATITIATTGPATTGTTTTTTVSTISIKPTAVTGAVTMTTRIGTAGIAASTTQTSGSRPGFDAGSFVGGIVLAVGLAVVGFFGYKCYQRRRGAKPYQTL